jgi:phage gpG-like protein
MDKFRIEAKLKAFQQVKAKLPLIVGNIALNHFLESFDKGGFTDSGFQKWKARKREDRGRAILVKTGALRDALVIKGRPNFNRIVIGDYVPYAAVHNDGLRAGRGKGFQMPKRQFVGDSKVMNRTAIRAIINQINKVMK